MQHSAKVYSVIIPPLYGCSAIGVLPAASPQSKGSALKNWDVYVSTIKFCAV